MLRGARSGVSTCDDAGRVIARALAAAVGAGLAEAGAGRAEAGRVGPVGGRRGRGQGRGGGAQERVARNRTGRMAARRRLMLGHERHTRRRRRNRGEVENRAGAQQVHGAGGTAFGVVSGRLSEWD